VRGIVSTRIISFVRPLYSILIETPEPDFFRSFSATSKTPFLYVEVAVFGSTGSGRSTTLR